MIFQPGFGEHFSGSFVSMQRVLYDFIGFNNILSPVSRMKEH